MAHRKTERNPLFAGRWFDDDIILLCLRWYFRFKLSYRDLVAILGERGLSISHTTILRWVVRYADTCEKRWRRFERPVGGSWRVDETFIKVRGQWMYLYRAVDGQGNTVEFYLSRTRGIAAAKAFFRKALKHHPEPHSITLDGHQPSHSALRRMGMNGEFNFRGRNPVKIRCCQYLNNVVEQDHRRVKGRLRPMLGFKTFYNARRVIIGIELAQKIHKRQFDADNDASRIVEGVTSRNGKNRTLRPIERRAGPELALFNLLVQPPAMVQSIVSKELIGRDMLELAFRVRVEAAHPDVADAVTVHGVLLNPVCQEELYNPGRDVSINPK